LFQKAINTGTLLAINVADPEKSENTASSTHNDKTWINGTARDMRTY
jgi:hypothetical protein